MDQISPPKKTMSKKKKIFLAINIAIIFTIQIAGMIVAEIFHLSCNSGWLPRLGILLSIIPFCNTIYIGEKWAAENKKVFLKFFLFFLLCCFSFAVVYSFVFLIFPPD